MSQARGCSLLTVARVSRGKPRNALSPITDEYEFRCSCYERGKVTYTTTPTSAHMSLRRSVRCRWWWSQGKKVADMRRGLNNHHVTCITPFGHTYMLFRHAVGTHRLPLAIAIPFWNMPEALGESAVHQRPTATVSSYLPSFPFVTTQWYQQSISPTIVGRLRLRHEGGLSYNVLATFRVPVKVSLLPSSMILCKLCLW
jgi:hypothetical protein